MFPIRHILHATDFSAQSAAAFDVACALARDYSAKLTILHVWSPPPVYAPDGIAVPMTSEDVYKARVSLAAIRPQDPTVKTEHVLAEGDPTEQILHHAREASADLIVMGTHGSSGLTRLLMGSVAESVTRRAECPVLTLRKPVHSNLEASSPQLAPVAAAN
jgi:nucleotide-binding universal stress UspA family protein